MNIGGGRHQCGHKGPIQQQLRDALQYIQNVIITEKVIKHPDRAEADLKVCEEGFSKLQELLEEQKEGLQKTKRTFAVVHTDALIGIVKSLMEKVKKEMTAKRRI